MAIDLIVAYETEIIRLDQSIQQQEGLAKNDQLDNEQLQALLADVSQRWLLNLNLTKLKKERDQRAGK